MPPAIVTALVAENPGEQTLVADPETVQVQPEEPKVASWVEGTAAVFNYGYLLLLLLLPIIFWFLAGSSVHILVPKGDNKRWYVNVEKLLEKYLGRYGMVVVDFRGGFLKGAQKSVSVGKKILGSSDMRYALVNEQRITTWTSVLKKKFARLAG